MKILLMVHYNAPGGPDEVLAVITEDETVLQFHGVDLRRTKCGEPINKIMDEWLFRDYYYGIRHGQCPSYKWMNRDFQRATTMCRESYDHIVFCEAV